MICYINQKATKINESCIHSDSARLERGKRPLEIYLYLAKALSLLGADGRCFLNIGHESACSTDSIPRMYPLILS